MSSSKILGGFLLGVCACGAVSIASALKDARNLHAAQEAIQPSEEQIDGEVVTPLHYGPDGPVDTICPKYDFDCVPPGWRILKLP